MEKSNLIVLILIQIVICEGGPFKPPKDKDVYWHNVTREELPTSINWGDHLNEDGVRINYLTTTKNQHLPRYCGSCWAQAITSSLSDRINIHINKGVGPEVSISPQMLVSCSYNVPKRVRACSGGDTWEGIKWVSENYLYPESCFPYAAVNGTCPEESMMCYSNKASGEVVKADYSRLKKYSMKDIRNLTVYFDQLKTELGEEEQMEILKKNELNMMAELRNGPIICGLSVSSEVHHWRGEGVYTDATKVGYNHDISVVGYNDDNGDQPYWIVRNSWGDNFGYNGFFNVLKGKGILGVELICRSGLPVILSQEESRRRKIKIDRPQSFVSKFKSAYESLKFSLGNLARKEADSDLQELIPGYLRNGLLEATEIEEDLPESFYYGNYQGQNILSWTVNQNRPSYCNSGHIQSAVASLSDRINKLHVDSGNISPRNRVTLSTQQLLNCGVGSCDRGGNHLTVYDFIQKNEAVPLGCQLYSASSPPFFERKCSKMQVCADCDSDGCPEKSKCFTVAKYKKYKIKSYGIVRGPLQMKTEILRNGPISCFVMSTEKLAGYKEGIFSEYVWNIKPNHHVSVVGWDIENGLEYWIVRNSWGVMWGEDGYMRIQMYEANLGIETGCAWAIPEIPF